MFLKTLERSVEAVQFNRNPINQPETVEADVVCYYKTDSTVKVDKVPTGSELRIKLESLLKSLKT